MKLAGQELAAARLIGDLLHQDLADTLRHAAVNLTGQRQRIDHGADVIDHEYDFNSIAPVSGSTSTSQT